ncbi:hypothetical protein ANTRET_LOCUS5475 [Anthophora retusa]
MISVIVILKYGTICVRKEKYKQLLEHLIADWYNLKDAEEINALKAIYSETSFYNMLILLFSYTFTSSVVLLQTLPQVTDRISHLNRTTPQTLLITTEYFVDSNEYFYPILIHVDLSVLLSSLMQVSSDILNAIVMMHISGMFEVIGLFKMCEACILDVGYTELILGTLTMAGNLLILGNMKSSMHTTIVSAIAIFTYSSIIYVSILPAAKIWENSEDLFYKAYSGKWYTAPAKSQRILLFLMQRLMIPSKMEVQGFVCASNELYVKMVRYGFSYSMVLCSLQE